MELVFGCLHWNHCIINLGRAALLFGGQRDRES